MSSNPSPSKTEAALKELRGLLAANLVIQDEEIAPYKVGYHDGMQRLARDAWEVLEKHVPETPTEGPK